MVIGTARGVVVAGDRTAGSGLGRPRLQLGSHHSEDGSVLVCFAFFRLGGSARIDLLGARGLSSELRLREHSGGFQNGARDGLLAILSSHWPPGRGFLSFRLTCGVDCAWPDCAAVLCSIRAHEMHMPYVHTSFARAELPKMNSAGSSSHWGNYGAPVRASLLHVRPPASFLLFLDRAHCLMPRC